jgi:dipeptidyl-peptidase-4
VRQRYPVAGTANATVELKLIELAGGNVVNVDLGSERNIYLARRLVSTENFWRTAQPRNQQRLDLLRSRP